MLVPTYAETLEMLCIQAGGNDRAEELFGGCLQNVMRRVPPFLIGSSFPEMYLEFPWRETRSVTSRCCWASFRPSVASIRR